MSRHWRWTVKKISVVLKSLSWQSRSLNLDQEIVDFYKYLDRDFSSQPFLFSFYASKLASKWAKSLGNSKILIISKNHGYLDLSRLVSTISIKILMQPNLDAKVLILKILTKKKSIVSWHKGQSWQFSKVGLHTKDNLDFDLDWFQLSRPQGIFLIQNIVVIALQLILQFFYHWHGGLNSSFKSRIGLNCQR